MSRRRVKPGSTMGNTVYEYYFLGRWRRRNWESFLISLLPYIVVILIAALFVLRIVQIGDYQQMCEAQGLVYSPDSRACIEGLRPWSN